MYFTYIIFVIGALLYFNLARFKPQFLPFALTLLLPAYQIRIQIGILPTTLLEVCILATLTGVLLYQRQLLHDPAVSSQQSAISDAAPVGGAYMRPLPLLALSLLAIATLQIFFSPDKIAALGLWRAYFLEPVALYFLFSRLIQTTNDKKKILSALLMLLGLLAAVELWQYAGFLPSPQPWISEIPRRVTGFFGFPNAVGLFATPIVALMLGILLYPPTTEIFNKKQIRVLWGGVAAGIIAILLANVRGALLGITAAYVFSIFFTKNKKLHLTILSGAILLILLIPFTRNTAFRIITLQDTSSDVRVVLWQGTANLLTARPLTGAGLGGFPHYYPEYKLAKHTEILQYPHDIFLNFWSELGVLGLAWAVTFFIVMVVLAVRYLNNGRESRIMNQESRELVPRSSFLAPILISFLALLIYGLVDVPYFKNDLAILWWLFVAMI